MPFAIIRWDGRLGRSLDVQVAVGNTGNTTMHIALVIPNLKAGGAERMVLNLAQGLIDRGHRVDILLIRPRFHYVRKFPRMRGSSLWRRSGPALE